MRPLLKITDSFYLNGDHVLYFYVQQSVEGDSPENSVTKYSVKAELNCMMLGGKEWESVQRNLSMGSFDSLEEAQKYLQSLVEKYI